MKVIGITGGIGSGKSTVLHFMKEEFQAVVRQADLIAHSLMKPGEECYHDILQSFGTEVLHVDGSIDRKLLGEVVFSNNEELEKLNQIVHPRVKEVICQDMLAERLKGTDLFVIEAALLIEDHYDMICDELWYIYADLQSRRRRLKAERGYNDEKIDSIFAAQSTEEFYRSHCRHVIDNSGDFEETERQIRNLGEYR